MPSVLPQQLFQRTSRYARAPNLRIYNACVYQNVTGVRFAKRRFHASQVSYSSRDQSTIDFAYFPQEELEIPETSFVIQVPILPDNYSAPNSSRSQEPVMDSVIRPEIFTVSANGTHIDNPSAMSDVVDNHAAEIDHFDLTKHVTNAANRVVKAGTESVEKQSSSLRSFWEGLLDDVLGEKKPVHV